MALLRIVQVRQRACTVHFPVCRTISVVARTRQSNCAATGHGVGSNSSRVRWHGGGHGHSHRHPVLPGSLTAPEGAATGTKNPANAVLSAGLLSDFALAAVKGAAGIYTGSSALISDAIHSAADMLISATAIVTTRYAAAAPDKEHPYGHGRLDSLGALAVSTLLTGAGLSIGWRAFGETMAVLEGKPMAPLLAILEHTPTELLANPQIAMVAIGACLASMGLKEYIYRWTMKVGMALRSQILIANAWHHRADSLSSLVAAIGIGGAMAGVPILDPVAALVVAAMISKAGVEIGWTSLRELMDTRMDDDAIAVAVDCARRQPDIRGIRSVRARRMGPSVLIDMECGFNPDISVQAAHAIIEKLRNEVFRERKEVSELLVHLAPADIFDASLSVGRPGSVEGSKATSQRGHPHAGILAPTVEFVHTHGGAAGSAGQSHEGTGGKDGGVPPVDRGEPVAPAVAPTRSMEEISVRYA